MTLHDWLYLAVALALGACVLLAGRVRSAALAREECPDCDAKWETRGRTASRAADELAVLRAEHDGARHRLADGTRSTA